MSSSLPPADEPLPDFCDTDDPNYVLWAMQQGLKPVLTLLSHAGLVVHDALCQQVAQVVLVAALAGKMLLDQVTAEQARHMVLAAVLCRLIGLTGELQRHVPAPWQPTAAELDVVETFCQTGTWKMDRPAALVDEVKQRVRRLGVARLELTDAVFVGLLLTVEGRREEAARMLDVEAPVAMKTLAQVWRRFEVTVLHVVEQTLRDNGRRVPIRYSLN